MPHFLVSRTLGLGPIDEIRLSAVVVVVLVP